MSFANGRATDAKRKVWRSKTFILSQNHNGGEGDNRVPESPKNPLFSKLRLPKTFLSGLLMGVMIFPLIAHAGFFSFMDSLFGQKTEASELTTNTTNSQNLSILEAPLAPDLKAAKSADTDIAIDNDALVSETGPVGTAADISDTDESANTISIYVAHKGDTIAGIAKMFEVSQNTIIWANDLKKGQSLTEGQTLIILPVSGVRYTVKKGDTLASIAKKYKLDDPTDIENYNDLSDGLVAGMTIVIPGGEITVPSSPQKSSGGTIPRSSPNDSGGSADGYFIRPVSYACPRTQGRHDTYAVDLGCPTGTPIKAAASGTVMFAKLGWNGGYGNLVIVSHANGTQTFYAHQSRLAASQGEHVDQGQVIGYVGSTGHSTGPHLHFEVRGAKNPGFSDSPSAWKKQ